ncbi:MAG: methionyl-tRNA formyltransferase [Brevefilum sp.]|nr:methionyl-tRNA formyltransferase [Brevefilum sp.]MDW7754101.1 methionyl-tRNA formyltransferase [Brevefilum sp.]
MTLRIVFMGSPDFALPTLKALESHFNVVGVVTQPDRPAGRGRKPQAPDVKKLAITLGLPYIQPATLKDESALQQLSDWAPDVIVVAAFGQILRENVLNLPPFGCVNVHASLLPRWRGAAPMQAALLHDDVTGVTIMKMDKGLDTGPILSQRSIPISDDMTAGKLFDQLAVMGADLLLETLPKYINGEIKPQPQDDEYATYAPRLKKEDGMLDFSQPASFLARMVRAYNPWPGAYQFYNGTRLKVYKAHVVESINAQPGARLIYEEKPAWGTGQGLLILDQVQAAGKSRLSGKVFLRGAKDWIEDEENGDGV